VTLREVRRAECSQYYVANLRRAEKMAAVTGNGKTLLRRGGGARATSLLLVGALLVAAGSGSHVINIGVILPLDTGDAWSLRFAGPAIEYAIASVQRRPLAAVLHPRSRMTPHVSLPNHVLRVEVNDSRCSDTWGPLSAFDMYLTGRVNLFLGPVCEYAVAAVARYSPHWDIPVITPGALVAAFDNRAKYRLLTRIAGSYSKLAESLDALLQRFVWRPGAVGLIYQKRARKSRATATDSESAVGKSDCYFVMQAVHQRLEALLRLSTAAASNSSSTAAHAEAIWYQSIEPDALDVERKLREMALHARSKSTQEWTAAQIMPLSTRPRHSSRPHSVPDVQMSPHP